MKTEYTENLRLVDRVFLLGDIVARATDQIGQTGIVVGMRMFCDLRRSDGTKLKRVPTQLLQPLTACRPGALVVHMQSHWLGRVDEVYDNVQISFDDGSSCKVMRTGANTLSVHSPTMDEQTWFWPGMRVSASRDVLRRPKLTKGAFRSSYVGKEATVVRVQAAQALVRWLAAAPVESADAEHVSIDPPPDMQRPSRLLELTQHHSRLCWRLAEHATLLPEDAERLLIESGMGAAEAAAAAMTSAARKARSAGSKAKKPSPRDTCVEVTACHTRVDVIWQDGSREDDIAATAFAPAKHVDGYYEFWPQDYVVGKAVDKDEPPPVGVIESVNHAQRLCVITWRGGKEKEIVPVYEIAPHPDFGFKVGDIVLRLPKAVQSGDAATQADDGAVASSAPTSAEATQSSSSEAAVVAVSAAASPGAAAASPGAAAASAGAAASSTPAAGDEDMEGDEDEDGASDAEGGMSASRGRSSLSMIGEVKTVGPMLEVVWMDGTCGMIEPEEAYVVNVEEEDEPPPEEEEGSYDDEYDGAEASYYDDEEPSAEPAHGRGRTGRRASRDRKSGDDANDDDGDGGGNSSGWETVSDNGERDEKTSAKASKRKGASPADATVADVSDAGGAGGEASVSTSTSSGKVPPNDAVEGSTEVGAGAASLVAAFTEGVSLAGGGQPPEGGAGSSEVGEEAYGTAEEDGGEDQDGVAKSESEESAARAAKAARLALANGQSGPSGTAAAPLGSGAMTEADKAALEAYAEHEQFWVDEGEGSWSWHRYYDTSAAASSSSDSSSKPPPAAPSGPSAKVAQKQWKLLKAGLPAGIFVVACPSRVDLLRAMIVGPPGTPYQDAVFLFDLQLPPEFPQQPPSVHYLSHGQRINPNLYENGKVCLSLLGTWTGRLSCELWNPQQSSVLQILISIQGLVLCEMPYFNEAGYDKQLGTAEGAHHARRYNEGAMLLSLKAMLTSLKHTEASGPVAPLVELHFASTRRRILARCQKLLELKDDPAKAAAAEKAAAAAEKAAAEASSVEGAGGAALGSGGAGASAGKSAVCDGPVAEAELDGVLNVMPSLGFLHSLARQMEALTKALEAADGTSGAAE